jgi:hypothetical protein
MTTTQTPPHAVVLLEYLRAAGPVTFTDTGLFGASLNWKRRST